METNKNENTTVQKPWDAAKVFIRGKYIPIQVYLRKKMKKKKKKRKKEDQSNKD